MKVRAFTFSQFHNKNPVAGSTHIRVNQLIDNWDEYELYKYGENPDVLILQKVYIAPDYQFIKNFKNTKILDICDPDWFNGKVAIKETIDNVDAVTTPTETMASFLRQLTDKPVVVIKDRFDITKVPEPKKHTGKAKTVVWFGYRHNIDTLKPAMPLIDEYNLNLVIISNDDPLAYNWSVDRDARDRYTFIKYNEDTIYEDLQKADFAVFPKGLRPEDHFKSENKTVKAQLAGLPVAHDLDSFNEYMDCEKRKQWFDTNYDIIKAEYDVNNSVNETKALIKKLSEN